MKTKKTLGYLATILMSVSTGTVYGLDQVWNDGNGDNSWNTTSLNWDVDAVWAQGNGAIFGGTGEVVTLGQAISVSSLSLLSEGYEIAGGGFNLSLAATTGTISSSANGKISAGVTLAASPTISVAAGKVLTMSGVMSGPVGGTYASGYTAGLKKMGDGVLVMSGANTYTGLTLVEQGVVRAQSNSAIGTTGTPAQNYVVVRSGAAVELDQGYGSSAKRFHFQGTGVNGGGAIRNLAGSNSLTGNNYMTGAARVQSDSGMLTIAGQLNANVTGAAVVSALTVGGAGEVTLSATNAQVTTLTKDGSGSFYITGSVGASTKLDVVEGNVQLTGTYPATATLNLGGGTTSGKLVLGGSSAVKNQTVAGLTSSGTGVGNAIVGGNMAVSTLTVSVASGSNRYEGALGGSGSNENALSLVKAGAGSLVLAGLSQYSGNTVVNAGSLIMAGETQSTGNTVVNAGIYELAETGKMKFVVSDLGNTTLSGAGGAVLNGKFVLDVSGVTATQGSWKLEDVAGVTGGYGSTFQCVTPGGQAWTDAGSDRWTMGVDTRTFTFDETTGTLTVEVVSPPSGYPSWADANAPGQLPTDDHDGDGVTNGIEYFMGETGNGFTVNPSLDANQQIAWTKSAQYSGVYGTDYWVETSGDLATWTPVGVADVSEAGGKLSYTLPAGQGKLFVRLRVVVPAQG